MVHEAYDGSVYLETTRPGYKNYFLIGYSISEDEDFIYDERYDEEYEFYNTAYASCLSDVQYHESFAFRVMCKDCSTKYQCLLWRLHDEFKLYATKLGYLKTCKKCGSGEWFHWRVHIPDSVDSSIRYRPYDCTNKATRITLNSVMKNAVYILGISRIIYVSTIGRFMA